MIKIKLVNAEDGVATRFTRHKLTLTFIVPTVVNTAKTATIQIFFDRNNVAGEKGDNIFQIILGTEPQEKTDRKLIVVQPVCSNDDFQPDSLASLLNDALAEWLKGFSKTPLVTGNEWESWFDSFCDEVEKRTGVEDALLAGVPRASVA